MGITKEKARQNILGVICEIFSATRVTRNDARFVDFDGHTWQEIRDAINTAINAIELDHQKIKLPREVGEDLEDWLAVDNVDDILDDLVCVYDGDHLAVRDWWESTLGATYLIADMARYGWEAEPEKQFYVEAPENWNAAVGQEYRWVSMRGGEFNLTVKGQAQTFTRAELKQYHLDNDIFTLVPVEDKEVSR